MNTLHFLYSLLRLGWLTTSVFGAILIEEVGEIPTCSNQLAFQLMSMKLNHQVLHETLPVVSGLNNENWDQNNGVYSSNRPCCIGAHLANHFNSVKEYGHDHILGRNILFRKLGIDKASIYYLLHLCGTSAFPFGWDQYPSHPKDVWKRMMMIEGVIDIFELYELYRILSYKNKIYPNIIVDKPELFEGVLEFNDLHPKFNNLHLEFKKVKLNDKKLALV